MFDDDMCAKLAGEVWEAWFPRDCGAGCLLCESVEVKEGEKRLESRREIC